MLLSYFRLALAIRWFEREQLMSRYGARVRRRVCRGKRVRDCNVADDSCGHMRKCAIKKKKQYTYTFSNHALLILQALFP